MTRVDYTILLKKTLILTKVKIYFIRILKHLILNIVKVLAYID